MTRKQQDKRAEEMYNLYKQGYSLEQVGKAYGVTRQSVYGLFKKRGYELRGKKPLPFVMFNGLKYTPAKDGYYRRTDGDRTWLHQDVWRFYRGEIPSGHHIHHKDKNKQNNSIENLECLLPEDHARIHHFPSEVAPKQCLFCGEDIKRKVFNSGIEERNQYNKRLYCSPECASKHKIGKPKNWSPRAEMKRAS